MGDIFLRFYEELNDFLPPKYRKRLFSQPLFQPSSVKHVIQSLGIPHTEVDLILVNGQSVDFSYRVRPGDRISVYPVFESFDISSVTRLRPKPLRNTRFVVDVHLGKLARYLRFLGFDTLYRNDYDDATLVRISTEEQRILLTRDSQLLQRRIVTRGHYVHATQPKQQIAEVLRHFPLSPPYAMFSRCSKCNGILKAVKKSQVQELLPSETFRYYERFVQCQQCHKLYWKGSQYQKMRKCLQEICAWGKVILRFLLFWCRTLVKLLTCTFKSLVSKCS